MKKYAMVLSVLLLSACAKEPDFGSVNESSVQSAELGGGFPAGANTGFGGGTTGGNPMPVNPGTGGAGGTGYRTLSFPTPVVWKTGGEVCKPYGYVSDLSLGNAMPCTRDGELTTVEWTSALPQPNGCPAGQSTVFTNTYVCRVCPRGYSVVRRDVSIPAGLYPSGWQTPAHVIPAQESIVCN
jgi:hypothetical protein